MVLNVLISVSQWEREVISERTKLALKYKKDNAQRYSGYAPYGYRFDAGMIVADDGEQDIIRFVKQLREAEDRTYESIGNILSDHKFMNRNGKRFTISAIHRIVHLPNNYAVQLCPSSETDG